MEKKSQPTGPYSAQFEPSSREIDFKKGEASRSRRISCELPVLPRKNEADLTDDEKNAFNAVIAQLIADGSYQTMIEIHSVDIPFEFMHGHHSDEGKVRFLPWHRVYLYELEKLISNYNQDVKIPYWNWIENPTIPSWVDQQNASRSVGGVDMPDGDKVCEVYNKNSYLKFSEKLEGFHNTVHSHVGGTMNSSASPTDPIFWLHHCFIDKIWNDWQQLYPGDFVEVDGSNVLDPWTVEISEAQDITDFCTYYEGLESCLHAINDNNTRDIINRMNCDEINTFTDNELVDLVNNMISGFTGNSDEQAILKLFNCLDCDRLSRIVNDIGTDTLLSNFHGAEDDELQLLLGKCGIISMASWDDDATRDFVNQSSCSELNALSDNDLCDLINNMLSGATYNADEQAILKILKCLTCDRLSDVVNLVGLDDLLDNFHGAEDDELRLLLGTCDIISFSSWDDDTTRDFVNQSNCTEINALSNSNLKHLINNMLSGATYNEDEQAILKILNCLSCDKLSDVVNLVGLDNLLDNIHGAEDDELKLLLGKCGIISFSSWNDDVTRAFVDELSCSEINALSNNDLRDLINNMISGSTGNADEQAILKILGCLNCSDRTSVVDKVGKSTLLSNLHGDEDDQLRDLFDECGI